MKDFSPHSIFPVVAFFIATGLAGWIFFCPKGLKDKSLNTPDSISSSVSSVEFKDHGISLSVPSGWGSLVTWNVGNRGNLIEGDFRKQDVLRGWGSGELGGATRNFSEYPYMSKDVPKSNVAANVSLSFYPEKFNDDVEREYGFMLKKEKEAAFQPLFQIYQRKGIADIDLEQHIIILPDNEQQLFEPKKSLRFGYWWGNGSTIDDRVAVKYYENSDGSLRGIGYFNFGTQEPNYGAASAEYRVVLLNTDKRMLVEFYFPIEEFKELEQFYNKDAQSGIQFGLVKKEDLKREYEYLLNESNYRNTELGKFIKDIEKMVTSLRVVE